MCCGVTFVVILLFPLFANSILRLIESFRDLGTSFVFYFYQLLSPDYNPIVPTVLEMPEWELLPEIWEPIKLLPSSWEEFAQFWSAYFSILFDWHNFLFYWYRISDFLFYGSRILLLMMPLGVGIFMLLSMNRDKECRDRDKKSLPLVYFLKFQNRVLDPTVVWCKAFLFYLKAHPGFYYSWVALFCLYFNVYSVFFSFLAYYLYFVSSWNLLTIYGQLLKLQKDLTPVIRFVPGILWFLGGAKLYNMACCKYADKTLAAAERANRAVIKLLSIISCVGGNPGAGKTTLITSMALTTQAAFFDDAFKIMRTREQQFPNFPWQRLRDELLYFIARGVLCDINQVKKLYGSRKRAYDYMTTVLTDTQLRRMLRKHPEVRYYTYGYNFRRYRSSYVDGVKVVHLYDAIESYAAAYMLYSVKTNLIFSNYSIRTDSQISDKGNLPLRDNDFFDRDPANQAAYSRYSHILDFDILRPGKKIIAGNKNANGAPVGVYVISEIDKEFKNMNLLKEMKINAEETNQKNDLHDVALMMIRHGAVIDYVPFVKVFADLQRPEAWGAGGRELGSVIFIADKTPMLPALPVFSTYWFTEGIYAWIQKKWDKFYADHCYRRADETLSVYLGRNLISAASKHYERLQGMYGMQTLLLEIQSGKMDDEPRQEKWRIMSFKDFAVRNRTDCQASIYDKPDRNTMHIDDFDCYAGVLATKDECAKQNSYFQRDIHKMKENSN